MDDVERKLRELGERTDEQLRHGEVPRAGIVRRVRLRRGAAAIGTCAVVALVAAVAIPRLGDVRRNEGIERTAIDLAAVVQSTEDAGTARIEIEMTLEMTGDEYTTRGVGVADFERLRSRLVLEDTGVLGRAEIVMIGNTTYQRELGKEGTGAEKWYETMMPDHAGASAAFGMGGDPSSFLAYLNTVSEEVTRVGEDTLDGVRTTHYRAELQVPALGASMAEDMQFQLEPVDVWVDDEGLLRRVEFGVSSDASTGLGSAHFTMRLWDFGVPVDIAAPPPEDVTDEPPSAWGGPGTELIGDGGVTMIMGEGRIETPYVEVDAKNPSFIEACVHSSRPVTGATLVHEPSGRRVFIFEPVHSDGHFEGPLPVACVEEAITHADVDALVDDPTEFTLIVRRKEGNRETVRLTIIASSLEGGDDGE